MALKSTGSFKYKTRDPDAVKRRAEQDAGTFDSIFKGNVDTFRPKNGDNTIRFLPPTWDDSEHHGFDVWVHDYVGADNGSYLCIEKMKKKKCPLCEASKEAASAGEADEAKQLKAKKKVVHYVLDRDSDDPVPLVYAMGWTMDRDVAALCHNRKTGKVTLIDDPDNGYDFSFKKTGAGLKTRYIGLMIDRDQSPLLESAKAMNKVLAKIEETPIPSVLLYRDAEFLQNIVDGTSSRKDPDEDDETPKRKKRVAEEGDEEEQMPKRKRATYADSDPDDDDDETPPPKKKRPVVNDDDDE